MATLSPTRAGTFRSCPRRYRYRYVDHLDEPEEPAALRGTLVHRVCEELLGLPPEQRTLPAARALLHHLWEVVAGDEPGLADLFADAAAVDAWLASGEALLATWFRLESPPAVRVDARELVVRASFDGVDLVGVLDRLDHESDGSWTVVDYKTGSAPGAGFEQDAFFQLRCYGVALAAEHGIVPTRLRVVYLGGVGEVLDVEVPATALPATARNLTALAAAIEHVEQTGDWRGRPGYGCRWCAFAGICPDAAPAASSPDAAPAASSPDAAPAADGETQVPHSEVASQP